MFSYGNVLKRQNHFQNSSDDFFFFFSNFSENVCLRTQWKFASLVSTPVKVVAAAAANAEKDTMSWHSGQRKKQNKKKNFEIGPGFPKTLLAYNIH